MTRRLTRRRLLARAALAAGGASLAGIVRAAALAPTPAQAEGPFYPEALPLDHDNDLVRVAGRPAPAGGTPVDLVGRILTRDEAPVAGARVEIWQCDAQGRYHHSGDPRGPADPNFQGFGATRSAADGGYRFRTILPVPYPGRTPHIHFIVAAPGLEPLTTQMYLAGNPANERDWLYRRAREAAGKMLIETRFVAGDAIDPGIPLGRFDIVLG